MYQYVLIFEKFRQRGLVPASNGPEAERILHSVWGSDAIILQIKGV
jgi:hypothetical protein